MEYLKEYASNIVVVSILSTIFEIILPEGKNKKIVCVVIGLVVMLAIMSPLNYITQITGSSFFPIFEVDESFPTYEKNLVADVFENNLATAIKEKTKESLKKDISCEVLTSRNDAGEITEIESVKIIPFDDEVALFIETEFGLDARIIKGEDND